MRGMGWASLIVVALSCLKSTQNRRLPSFIFTMTTGEARGLLEGWMTLLEKHLLHLCHLFSSDGRALAALWLVKRWPLDLDCVL